MRAFFEVLDAALAGVTAPGLLLAGLPFFVLWFMLVGFSRDGAEALLQIGIALWVLAIPVFVVKVSRHWREEYRALALVVPVVVAAAFVSNAYGSTTRSLGLVNAGSSERSPIADASERASASASAISSAPPGESLAPSASPSATSSASPSDVVPTVSGRVPMHRMDLLTPVARGQQVKVTVRTIPGVRCAVTAAYMTADVNNQTIPPQLVPANGVVEFVWTVDPSATPGAYTVQATCSSQTSSSSLKLTLVVT